MKKIELTITHSHVGSMLDTYMDAVGVDENGVEWLFSWSDDGGWKTPEQYIVKTTQSGDVFNMDYNPSAFTKDDENMLHFVYEMLDKTNKPCTVVLEWDETVDTIFL